MTLCFCVLVYGECACVCACVDGEECVFFCQTQVVDVPS